MIEGGCDQIVLFLEMGEWGGGREEVTDNDQGMEKGLPVIGAGRGPRAVQRTSAPQFVLGPEPREAKNTGPFNPIFL